MFGMKLILRTVDISLGTRPNLSSCVLLSMSLSCKKRLNLERRRDKGNWKMLEKDSEPFIRPNLMKKKEKDKLNLPMLVIIDK